MKPILAILGVAMLAGCMTAPAPVPEPVVATEVFRDPDAQIASQTDVTADRMAGTWHIRQRFAGAFPKFDQVTFSTLPNRSLQASVVLGACVQDVCEVDEHLILLTPTGPGRWVAVDPPSFWPTGDIWVMWMDFDSRTATLGTPSGAFGLIMDKNPTGGRDRIIAARDIMDWFGYDLGRLEEVIR